MLIATKNFFVLLLLYEIPSSRISLDSTSTSFFLISHFICKKLPLKRGCKNLKSIWKIYLTKLMCSALNRALYSASLNLKKAVISAQHRLFQQLIKSYVAIHAAIQAYLCRFWPCTSFLWFTGDILALKLHLQRHNRLTEQLEVFKRSLSSEPTMSKLTFISTFCILIVGATSMAVDQADQVRCPG